MKTSPAVSIVIVNYNGREVLSQCIEAISHLNQMDIEVIVVDNASPDGSADEIPRLSRITVLRNDTNIGYAAAANAGIAHARGEYTAILNNDTVVFPTWLDHILPHFEADCRVWAVSSRQMCHADPRIVDSLCHYPANSLILKDAGRGEPYTKDGRFAQQALVLGPGGAAGVYRTAVVRQLGGYDERYFAYCEDADLTMRAFLQGWHCIYEPSAVVLHRGSHAFNRLRATAFYYGQRNILWFIYKFYPVDWIARAIPYILVEEARAIAVASLKLHKPGVWFKARRDSLLGLRTLRADRARLAPQFRARASLFRRFMMDRCVIPPPSR